MLTAFLVAPGCTLPEALLSPNFIPSFVNEHLIVNLSTYFINLITYFVNFIIFLSTLLFILSTLSLTLSRLDLPCPFHRDLSLYHQQMFIFGN